MGLYDAVDRAIIIKTDVIPDNVKIVAHARRDPAAGSRDGNPFGDWPGGAKDVIAFGNTGTSGGQLYFELFIFGTHAAMGGDPWGGDRPRKLTEEKDKAASIRADGFIRLYLEVFGKLPSTPL